MYTEEDLNQAVEAGIFTREAVSRFRDHIQAGRGAARQDEENFRLVSGFNDIFVVLACALLLISGAWIGGEESVLAPLTITLLSWPLAEFFVRRRKMALPAIFLLITFVGGVFATVYLTAADTSLENQLMIASAAAAVAAYLHWLRFAVPITVAAGAAAVATLIAASIGPHLEWGDKLLYLILALGVAMFLYAMYWDTRDRKRITRNTDVAFWLHLLSAPLIVHPVFSLLGILQGEQSPINLALVIALYLVLTLISLVVDRRAFMVSALVYVLYALNELLEGMGVQDQGFAFAGLLIGGSLLMLSGFWHKSRSFVLRWVPESVCKYVPEGGIV